MKKFYRAGDVSNLFSVSPSTIWRWTREGNFPKPTKLASRTTVWSQENIETFIEAKSL